MRTANVGKLNELVAHYGEIEAAILLGTRHQTIKKIQENGKTKLGLTIAIDMLWDQTFGEIKTVVTLRDMMRRLYYRVGYTRLNQLQGTSRHMFYSWLDGRPCMQPHKMTPFLDLAESEGIINKKQRRLIIETANKNVKQPLLVGASKKPYLQFNGDFDKKVDPVSERRSLEKRIEALEKYVQRLQRALKSV